MRSEETEIVPVSVCMLAEVVAVVLFIAMIAVLAALGAGA